MFQRRLILEATFNARTQFRNIASTAEELRRATSAESDFTSGVGNYFSSWLHVAISKWQRARTLPKKIILYFKNY
jgi:hypothetical protein